MNTQSLKQKTAVVKNVHSIIEVELSTILDAHTELAAIAAKLGSDDDSELLERADSVIEAATDALSELGGLLAAVSR